MLQTAGQELEVRAEAMRVNETLEGSTSRAVTALLEVRVGLQACTRAQ